MLMRIIRSWLVVVLWTCLFGGFQPSVSAAAPGTPTISVAESLARIHWLGKKQIAAETNAANVMSLWKLPASQRLETQTLDKLAMYLAGSTVTNLPPPTNYDSFVSNSPVASLLRPVLSDLVEAEWYLDLRRTQKGSPADIALALRLDDQRATLWETKLTAGLAAMPGVRALPAQADGRQWQLPTGRHFALARSGGWTAACFGRNETTTLARDILAQTRRTGAPASARATNYWIEADIDLGALAAALAIEWAPPSGWPKASVTVIGDGRDVRTRGELNFPRPLGMDLEPWILPTNNVVGTLCSFTAMRGISPWLAALKSWSGLQAGPPPNQLTCWSLQGSPLATAFAFPSRDASNVVSRLTQFIAEHNAAWFGTNELAGFRRSKTSDGLEWGGLGFVAPFLQSSASGGNSFVLGGIQPLAGTNVPLPADLIQILAQTNLVAYDWDITGMRVEQWVYLSQVCRLLTQRAQIPGYSASWSWLRKQAPLLGNCAATITRTGPSQLGFRRRSTVGFSAVELILLADWLESPRFPDGFYTLLLPAAPDDVNAAPFPPSPPPQRPARGNR